MKEFDFDVSFTKVGVLTIQAESLEKAKKAVERMDFRRIQQNTTGPWTSEAQVWHEDDDNWDYTTE